MDLDNRTELIRVPGHNNKAPMEVMNDFVEVSCFVCFKGLTI